MRDIVFDLRYAFRTLRRAPAFTIVAVLSLALGIAVNTAIFSVVNAILFGATPYPSPDRLVMIWETLPTPRGVTQRQPAVRNALDWADSNSVFEGIGLVELFVQASIWVADRPAEPVYVQGISSNLLTVLGVQPASGRPCSSEVPGILLTDDFFERRFDRNTKVLGSTVLLNGASQTILGVMPARFRVLTSNRIDAYACSDFNHPGYANRKDHWYGAVARLKPGTTIERAQAEMDTIAARLAAAYPEANKDTGAKVQALNEVAVGRRRQAALILMVAVGFVLLIACANVANLILARLTTRANEFTIRSSLGAGRARLVRQLLTEGAVLAAMGGILGGLLTGWVLDAIAVAIPQWIAGLHVTSADARVFSFTLLATGMTAVLFGLPPAWHVSRQHAAPASRITAGRSTHRLRSAMVVVEIALAIVLLTGTGLLVRTLLRIGAVDPGFDSTNVLTVMTRLDGQRYVLPGESGFSKLTPAVDLFYDQLLAQAAMLPGVDAAGYTSDLPDTGIQVRTLTISGQPSPPENRRPSVGYYEVSPSFFQTMRIPLRLGRFFDVQDRAGAPWTAVVDEAFAKQYFPGENPIGKIIRMRYEPYKVEEAQPRIIVGVVGEVKFYRRSQRSMPIVYASNLQQPDLYPGGRTSAHRVRRLLLRTKSDVDTGMQALVTSVRSIVAALDKNVPVAEIKTMDTVLRDTDQFTLYYARLLSIFGVLAAILAAVGIYGVMSYLVSERTREIGVRTALGAPRGAVMRLILVKSLTLTAIGVVCGVVGAFALTRLLAELLFGVTPLDPVTYAAVVLVLGSIALAAGYLPARRASKLDPLVALRHD